MTPSLHFLCVLAVVLCLSAVFVPPGAAQTEFPPCREDGSAPNGESQCECPQRFVLGEYRGPEGEYRLRLPDGIAAALGSCGLRGSLHISLTHPKGGEPGGDFPWNQIWVVGPKRTRETVQELADGFAKTEREDTEGIHATDLRIDQPMRTSLSSLTAIHLKASRTDLDHGKLICEVIIAKNPKKEIVYEIGMVSPAFRYEKDHKLFEAVVEGFRYIPIEDTASH